MRRPFNGNYIVNFPFGATSDPYSPSHPHRGNDYPLPSGTDLFTPEAGYLTQEYATDFGYHSKIDSPKYIHILAHESVQAGGGWVGEGVFVGRSGATGWTSGPHLHWQVLDKASGQWVNSELLLTTEKPDMKVNQDLGRIGYFHILGRNGVHSTHNALKGDDDNEIKVHIGKDAGEFFLELYRTGEAEEFRQKRLQEGQPVAQPLGPGLYKV